MRKTFLLLCASLFLGTQAQNLKPVITVGQKNTDLNALPKAYSADGKDHLLLLSTFEKKISVYNDDLGVQNEIDLSPYFGEQFAACNITKYRDTILVAAPEENYQKIYSDISYSLPMDSVNASSLNGLMRQVNDRLYDYLDERYVTIRETGRTDETVRFKVGLNDKYKGGDRVYFGDDFYMGDITCTLKNGKTDNRGLYVRVSPFCHW